MTDFRIRMFVSVGACLILAFGACSDTTGIIRSDPGTGVGGSGTGAGSVGGSASGLGASAAGGTAASAGAATGGLSGSAGTGGSGGGGSVEAAAGAAGQAGASAGAAGAGGATQKTVSFGPFISSPAPMNFGQAGQGGTQANDLIYYADSVILDLDQDGKVDWAGITDPHTTQIVPCTLAAMRGHGDGTFGPDLLFAIQAGNVCNGIFTADLAGDGKSSVAFLGDAVGSTHIITTKDGKTFAETQTLGPPCFSAADFTGDGRPEFLCAGTPKGTTQVAFQVALNDGNGVLTLGSDAFLPDGFLADRITFVRTAPPPSPQVAVFRNANAVSAPLLGKVSNGALTFSVSSLPPKIVAAVDIFSAGHSHLIDAAGAIWDVSSDLANATAVGSVGPLGFDATVDFADVDGDGRLDILAEDLLGSSAVIYRQNPDKTFAQVWSGTGYLRFADVNGDGRPDLVNRPDVTNIRVALNTSH